MPSLSTYCVIPPPSSLRLVYANDSPKSKECLTENMVEEVYEKKKYFYKKILRFMWYVSLIFSYM